MYDGILIERLIQVFISDNSDMYIYSLADQLKLIKGFNNLMLYLQNGSNFRELVINHIIKMTVNSQEMNDQRYFELMTYYNKNNLLIENEYLMAHFRQYVDMRFDFMDRVDLLMYCELLRDLGMLFDDEDIIKRLNRNFQSFYYQFELSQLFQLMRIQAYCFHKPPGMLDLILDSISICAKEPEQIKNLSYKDTIAFVEALTINGKESRPMGTVLSKILKQTTHLSEDHEVSLFTLAYLADFDLKLSNKRTAAL